ncbi:MAG: hypothetical protein ACH34V_05265 [Flavobacterium sp.]|uniref:Signal peptidase n=1 Tax=Flavobacterium celericrescens TaxID=2709780 RepID=A0ABX0IF49_9FLAO|nr:hypothetical protein [Flavobacterium celericrescens]NHM05141.1 hypothetical protein [Flavobacterium celericrescens]
MKPNLLKLYATIFMAFISFLSVAQPVDPPADDDPPASPINTKLVWLAIFGITFAFYYFKNQKKTSLQDK